MAGAGGSAEQIPENRRLPKKEQDIFRSIVKFYETKQYKKGLKAADTVLKKFPEHGETLAMKGLTLNSMDKKEEAYELCRRGLRNDLKSHVCWHVFGLLHRSDRNYKEAIKCYLNALRIDSENLQILRDLSLLQIQMRDLTGFVETKRKLLQLKSANKQNWIAYAVGNFLLGNYTLALKVIDSFMGTQDSREKGYDDSEMVLYKAMVLEKAGRFEDALAHLEAEKDFVVDKLAWRNRRAELLLRLGRSKEAEEAYLSLVEEHTENYRYHTGLQCAVLSLPPEVVVEMLQLKGCELPCTVLELDEGQREQLLALYDSMAARDKSKSLALHRTPLQLLQGEAFKQRVDLYMRKQLARALPSLGADLRSLFVIPDTSDSSPRAALGPGRIKLVPAKDPLDVRSCERFHVVCGLVKGYLENLAAHGTFSGQGAALALQQNGTSHHGGQVVPREQQPQPPTTLLWTRYLWAQLLEAGGQLGEAMAEVQKCVDHTPTAIDMLQRKARLLKRSGNISEAADVLDAARQLDLADRYINNKTTKYLLRAGRVEQAQSTIALFTKHEGDPQYNLFDMQCMWYELEVGGAHLRERRFGPALKQFAAVEKHFADFLEDQFDFHSYCIRKMTLRAYTDILRLEDEILGHEYHQRAVRGAVRCYLALMEKKPEDENSDDQPDYSAMTKEQKKKEKAKARKAAKKKEEEEEAAKAKAAAEEAASKAKDNAAQHAQDGEDGGKGGAAARKKRPGDRPPPVDDDPDGAKLAAKDPLLECARLVSILTRHGAGCVESHVLAYDVAIKRGKMLLALQALLRGKKLKAWDPDVFVRTVHFCKEVSTRAVHPMVAEVIRLEQPALINDQPLEAYVQSYFTRAADPEGGWGLKHRVAAAQGMILLKPDQISRASDLIRDGLKEGRRGVTVGDVTYAIKVLREDIGAPEQAAALMEEASRLYPLAVEIHPPGAEAAAASAGSS